MKIAVQAFGLIKTDALSRKAREGLEMEFPEGARACDLLGRLGAEARTAVIQNLFA